MHRDLNTSILGNDLGNPPRDQQQRLVVVASPHKRNGFPLKSTYLSIRQDRLQPIAHFNSCVAIVNGIQDQYAAIRGLAAYSPPMEEIDSVTLDIEAIERADGHHRDLGVRLFV